MATAKAKAPAPVLVVSAHQDTLPPDVVRLLDVFARIELRRQALLAAARTLQRAS